MSWQKILKSCFSEKKLPIAQLRKLEGFITSNDYGLNKTDLSVFKKLLEVLKKKPARDGMIVVNQYFDTFLRELIPEDIWKTMQGELHKKKSNGKTRNLFCRGSTN